MHLSLLNRGWAIGIDPGTEKSRLNRQEGVTGTPGRLLEHRLNRPEWGGARRYGPQYLESILISQGPKGEMGAWVVAAQPDSHNKTAINSKISAFLNIHLPLTIFLRSFLEMPHESFKPDSLKRHPSLE